MQTLIFNTFEKTTELRLDAQLSSLVSDYTFENVSTVAVRDGYYEIMKKKSDGTTVPVARLPISNTNMLIIND